MTPQSARSRRSSSSSAGGGGSGGRRPPVPSAWTVRDYEDDAGAGGDDAAGGGGGDEFGGGVEHFDGGEEEYGAGAANAGDNDSARGDGDATMQDVVEGKNGAASAVVVSTESGSAAGASAASGGGGESKPPAAVVSPEAPTGDIPAAVKPRSRFARMKETNDIAVTAAAEEALRPKAEPVEKVVPVPGGEAKSGGGGGVGSGSSYMPSLEFQGPQYSLSEAPSMPAGSVASASSWLHKVGGVVLAGLWTKLVVLRASFCICCFCDVFGGGFCGGMDAPVSRRKVCL